VDYYKQHKDGLEVLLLHGATALDPPKLPPTGYVNLMHRARYGKSAQIPDDDDYENAEDVLDEGEPRAFCVPHVAPCTPHPSRILHFSLHMHSTVHLPFPLTPPFTPPSASGGHDYINLRKEDFVSAPPPSSEQQQQQLPRKAALPSPSDSAKGASTSVSTSTPAPGLVPPTLPPRSADSFRKASVLTNTIKRSGRGVAGPAGRGAPQIPQTQRQPTAATSFLSPSSEDAYAFPNAPAAAGDSGTYTTPTLPPAYGTTAELARFQVPAERLQIVSELGAGQFGQVFEAWLQGAGADGQGKLVAVKTCRAVDDEKTRQSFLMEAQTLARFSHPNVLGLIGVCTTRLPWQIVVEHVVHGDLRAVLKSCRTSGIEVKLYEKLYMASQVAAGMAHMADLKFVHRDLAARNVLLGRYCSIKIADFGLSRQLGSESEYYIVKTRCLLPIRWMAPEALNYRKFTTASDVWAFGVVLWEIMSQAKTPWRKHTTQDVTDKVTAGERLPSPRECPAYMYEMMLECWSADAAKRPPFPALQRRLEDMCEQVRGTICSWDV
jgi:hypothetical protein